MPSGGSNNCPGNIYAGEIVFNAMPSIENDPVNSPASINNMKFILPKVLDFYVDSLSPA
jgi:hypothetical protein